MRRPSNRKQRCFMGKCRRGNPFLPHRRVTAVRAETATPQLDSEAGMGVTPGWCSGEIQRKSQSGECTVQSVFPINGSMSLKSLHPGLFQVTWMSYDLGQNSYT